ncbi:MAG: CarD family transcriptional regulator [bacterium]
MFQAGDVVVYPLQGAGTIERLEEHKVKDEIHKYYVIKLSASEMKIMVPVEQESKIGLRKAVEKEAFNIVFKILKRGNREIDWKEKYAANLEKMKIGSVSNVAEVAKCLCEKRKQKNLSIGEKRLFDNACNILTTELAYAYNIKFKEADSMIKSLLKETKTEE